MKKLSVVVLSGPSGAGKSTALKVMEDLGFFCVDNIPVLLIEELLQHIGSSNEEARVAIVADVRDREHIDELPAVLASIKELGSSVQLIYLDAIDSEIVKRFSVTRRPHPLQADEGLLDGIALERELLSRIRSGADRVIDTSEFNVHQLKGALEDFFSPTTGSRLMKVNFVSFGYRYGVPIDSDLVMDVRFLENPYFIDELKALPGTDKRVSEFLLSMDETMDFIERFRGLLEYLIPLYKKEGKSNLSIAIGCTGGMHRSVVIAEKLANALDETHSAITIRHRDILKS
ncbi:MAG: RNase adapter RapZ [Thermodesulfobacteriota bacterium]